MLFGTTSTWGTKKYWPAGKVSGVVKVTVNWTASPMTGPFPPVVWSGDGWMPPSWTEFKTRKGPRSCAVTVRLPGNALLSKSATSEGELTRVGTCAVLNVGDPEVRPTS